MEILIESVYSDSSNTETTFQTTCIEQIQSRLSFEHKIRMSKVQQNSLVLFGPPTALETPLLLDEYHGALPFPARKICT
jgi:hypothetical protein